MSEVLQWLERRAQRACGQRVTPHDYVRSARVGSCGPLMHAPYLHVWFPFVEAFLRQEPVGAAGDGADGPGALLLLLLLLLARPPLPSLMITFVFVSDESNPSER